FTENGSHFKPSPPQTKKTTCSANKSIQISGNGLNIDERLKAARERREEQQKLLVSRELSRLEREQRARRYYEQQLQERRKKFLEQRLKEERRRAAVEEKRKQRLREEKERHETAVRRTIEKSQKAQQQLSQSSRGRKLIKNAPRRLPLTTWERNLVSRLLTPTCSYLARSKSAACRSGEEADHRRSVFLRISSFSPPAHIVTFQQKNAFFFSYFHYFTLAQLSMFVVVQLHASRRLPPHPPPLSLPNSDISQFQSTAGRLPHLPPPTASNDTSWKKCLLKKKKFRCYSGNDCFVLTICPHKASPLSDPQPAEVMLRPSGGTTDPKEASRLLAEKRREARMQREKEEQERLQREEAERRSREEQQRRRAEQQARQEAEARRLVEEKKRREEEEQRRAEEERAQAMREAELLQKQVPKEELAKEQARAEQMKQEREIAAQKEEAERQARKKRLEEIMRRTRRTDSPDTVRFTDQLFLFIYFLFLINSTQPLASCDAHPTSAYEKAFPSPALTKSVLISF
uniref:Microtubule-associated protein 7a n=1 Tax=Poecilia reticulata TaxID=8081 RepID=A0A3P9PLK6_POERE